MFWQKKSVYQPLNRVSERNNFNILEQEMKDTVAKEKIERLELG